MHILNHFSYNVEDYWAVLKLGQTGRFVQSDPDLHSPQKQLKS